MVLRKIWNEGLFGIKEDWVRCPRVGIVNLRVPSDPELNLFGVSEVGNADIRERSLHSLKNVSAQILIPAE